MEQLYFPGLPFILAFEKIQEVIFNLIAVNLAVVNFLSGQSNTFITTTVLAELQKIFRFTNVFWTS